MIILLMIAGYFLYKYCQCKCVKVHSKTRNAEALFQTVVLFEAIILLLTNILSVFHLLTGLAAIVSWIMLSVLFLFLYMKEQSKLAGLDGKIEIKKIFTENKKALANSFKDFLTPDEQDLHKKMWKYMFPIMLIVILILSVALLFGTIFTVPYNYDSMTYHLGRIGYWIDHKSVAHYVTNIDRQVYSPVLAEYNLLYFILLAGNDVFANFLQFFCMYITAYFIYHSARKLGTGKSLSFFGAFIFMMMPLTISQSITTQNDLFAAMIFVLFVYKLIDVIKWEKIILDKGQGWDIFMLSLTVGYAYLAKTSVCASMLFFMPWLIIVRIVKKDSVKKLCGSVLIAVGGIIATISETLIRTFVSSGSFMTSTASGNIMVATKNIKYIIVNILKNFSMLITQNYFRPLNGFVYRLAIGLGQKWTVEVNNEAIAFHGFDFLQHMNMGDDMYSHDKTPSAFVAYLAVLAGVILVALIGMEVYRLIVKKEKSSNISSSTSSSTTLTDGSSDTGLSIGFAVSAWLSLGFIMALLRWQPWGTRLMYPALAITVIMSANMLECLMQKWKDLVVSIVLLMLIALSVLLAVPSVTYNLKPAIEYVQGGCQNRTLQYFRSNHRENSYQMLIEKAKEDQATDIGLIISGDGFDYPLWVMLREEYSDGKLRHLIAEDAGDLSIKAPDCIFMVERDVYQVGEEFSYAGSLYRCEALNEEVGDCYFTKIQ